MSYPFKIKRANIKANIQLARSMMSSYNITRIVIAKLALNNMTAPILHKYGR